MAEVSKEEVAAFFKKQRSIPENNVFLVLFTSARFVSTVVLKIPRGLLSLMESTSALTVRPITDLSGIFFFLE